MDEEMIPFVIEHTHNDDDTGTLTISGGPEGGACFLTAILTGMLPEESYTLIVDGETEGTETFEAV